MLVIGLVLSVALMGAAAAMIARMLNKHRWIGFVGLAVIAFVALKMIYEGGGQVFTEVERPGFFSRPRPAPPSRRRSS